MSDTVWLFLILAAVYGLECLLWLPPGSFLFASPAGRRFGLRWIDDDRRGVPVLAPPLPPLGTVFACATPPAAVSPEGLSAGGVLGVEEVVAVEAQGRALRAGGRRVLRAASARAARDLAELLRRLASLPEAGRAGAIDAHLARSLDAAGVGRRIEAFRSETDALRWLCNLLFLYLFVIAPGVVWLRGLPLTWAGLLPVLAVLQGLIVMEARRAHRALFPDQPQERWGLLMTILLSPPAACRAVDALGRELLGTYHPLAVAAVLLERPVFVDLARRMLHDVRRFDLDGAGLDRVERWHRRRLGDALERLTATCDLRPPELIAPPEPESEACLAYCPRCHEQYVIPEGQCASCREVGLRRFARRRQGRSPAAAPAALRS